MTLYFDRDGVTILNGDCRYELGSIPTGSVHCVVTSPPYWGLRDYGTDSQIGLEDTPEEYVAALKAVFLEVRRVLREDGTVWLNLGDSYAGSWGAQSRGNAAGEESSTLEGGSMLSARQILAHPKGTGTGSLKNTPGLKAKDLVGIPWRVALELQADGWYLRQDIIWHKPNPMPESVTYRCTKAHEYLFLMAKSERYYYDQAAILEPSVTNDIRRPYGSKGAWVMDGRPEEQKHGGEPRSFNGSKFNTGKTAEHQQGRSSTKPRKQRKPAGWDTGDGSHGTIHRDGRATEVEYTETECETRNRRSVWTIPTAPYPAAHFATFPPKLIEPCILAGCPEGGTVLDPFLGSGTTARVAQDLGRKCIGIELNQDYCKLAVKRFKQRPLIA